MKNGNKTNGKHEAKIRASTVCKALNISKERYRDLIDRKYIKPSLPAPGQGKPAFFTRDDVYDFAIFLHLVDVMNITRESAAFYVKGLRSFPPQEHNIATGRYDNKRHSKDLIWFIRYKGEDDIKGFVIQEIDLSKEDFVRMYDDLKSKSNVWDCLIIHARNIREYVDSRLSGV